MYTYTLIYLFFFFFFRKPECKKMLTHIRTKYNSNTKRIHTSRYISGENWKYDSTKMYRNEKNQGLYRMILVIEF